jgi:hypothetical protein
MESMPVAQRVGWWTVLLALVVLCAPTGCTRRHHRLAADREAYAIVAEKSNDPRWAVPGFSLNVDPRSRYFDPFNPDRPPMPADDPASHEFMRYVDCKRGWKHWLRDGVVYDPESPCWQQRLGEYVAFTDTGAVRLDLDTAVELAYMHSPAWRQQLETIYLSALDVSTERFRFDVQFFGGTEVLFTHNGRESRGARVIAPGVTGDRNTLTVNNDLQLQRRFATNGQLLVNFANSFVWQFAGPDTNAAMSLLSLNLVQPLLRAGGRAVALEQLTIVERALLANLRALHQYQQGFYTNIVTGEQAAASPQRRGGFFGGTGLTGFTGQGAGGFGGVGQATNFGGFGGGLGGGAAGGAVAGAAGGGAGTVGGFLGLLQQEQQIRNVQDSLSLKLRTLGLLEASLDAGLIDLTQVDSFRQSIQTDRANLLQARSNLENTLDTFKRQTLGLPPSLPMELDNSMIQQFQFIDRRMTEMQVRFSEFARDVSQLPADPTREQLSQAIERLTALRGEALELFAPARADLATLESRSVERESDMTPEEIESFRADKRRLTAALEELETRAQQSAARLEELRAAVAADTNRGQTANAIVAFAGELSDGVQELSLVQARSRLESVVMTTIDLTPEVALEVARANRLDWMNNRASLVDSWRLITFNANALRSNLTVSLNGDIATVGDNPVKFQAPTGNMSAGVQFDPPFTRLLERNNYRSVLISYQQDRRQLVQFEDRISQTLRQNLRQLEQLEANLALQRSAVAIALRRVDQTREDLTAPTAPAEPGQPASALGPTAAQNLISALTALSDSQNNFMSVWLNYYASRMVLMRELGIMRLDDDGKWIDLPLDQLLAESAHCDPLPPDVPEQWLRDAGINPEELKPPAPVEPGQEPLPPGSRLPPAPSEPLPLPGGDGAHKQPSSASVAKMVGNASGKPAPVQQINSPDAAAARFAKQLSTVLE